MTDTDWVDAPDDEFDPTIRPPAKKAEIPSTYEDQYGNERWSDTGEKTCHGR